MKDKKRYIAGINSINQSFENGTKIIHLHIDEAKKNKRVNDIITIAEQKNISITYVDKMTLDLMVVGSKHQGVVAQITSNSLTVTLDFILQQEKPVILLLDGIQDPHNLGACLRSAAAANVDAVIIPKNRSVGITPTVSQVACGGAEIIPLFIETNLSRTLEKCQKAGLWSVALSGHAEQTIYDVDLTTGIVLMMGNEANGLSQNLLNHSDYQAKIPMPGNIESLNISVATGIALFESIRQRGLK